MIAINKIEDTVLDNHIHDFDVCIAHLKNEFNIELKTYGNILRLALTNIQPDSFNNLIERLKINRELENALNNTGGYTLDYLEGRNPKMKLNVLLKYCLANPLKFIELIDLVNAGNSKKIVIADLNDMDFLANVIKNSKVNVISISEFKKNHSLYENLIFYSFNGKRDFNFISGLKTKITLLLYQQEALLYKRQLQIRKSVIENELCGHDRKVISGISYEPTPSLPINISQTVLDISDRIEKLDNREYDNYKDEADTLLDEIDEKIIYRIKLDNHKWEHLDSNETVFNQNGELIKAYRIKIGDKIRIYPKYQFADNLYQVAVETNQDVFGKVEEDSKLWLRILLELKQLYSKSLYEKLKAHGIGVLPTTVEGYFNGTRKFPMYNRDLKAIFKLKYPDNNTDEINSLITPIRQSKLIYNSTMIALGRGNKQELKFFLKEKRIGEILQKLKFTSITLQAFMENYMPLLTVIEKEILDDEDGQLELNLN